jgi:hypothetical protein
LKVLKLSEAKDLRKKLGILSAADMVFTIITVTCVILAIGKTIINLKLKDGFMIIFIGYGIFG